MNEQTITLDGKQYEVNHYKTDTKTLDKKSGGLPKLHKPPHY